MKSYSFTPDVVMFQKTYSLSEGEQTLEIEFDEIGIEKGYYFICFMKNSAVELGETNHLITGLMSVYNFQNPAVSNYGTQRPPENIGVHTFELWCPISRPKGRNMAMTFTHALEAFGAENLRNEFFRPVVQSNAWVANLCDANPTLTLKWDEPQIIRNLRLFFDTDADHAMESVQMGNFDSAMPFCVKEYQIKDDKGNLVYNTNCNHQTVNNIIFTNPIKTETLVLSLKHPSELVPAALFGLIIQ